MIVLVRFISCKYWIGFGGSGGRVCIRWGVGNRVFLVKEEFKS